MISFSCPSCGFKLKVKDEFAGKKAKCRQCQKVILIPSASTGEATASEPTAANHTRVRPASPTAVLSAPPQGDGETLDSEANPDAGSSQTADTIGGQFASEKSGKELYDFLAPPRGPAELGWLGSYRVLKVLGAGGMGVVFEAEDPQLQRAVALKAMLPTLAASESSRKRFLREAQAAAAISHDHIVQIYQVSEDRGVPFIAMQFLEGESLEDRMRRDRRLSVAEALRITRETALGLAAAQKRGLIHRDIKLANLWLEGDDARVKILDFGLARAASGDANLTQQGVIVGTPSYMAPEQASGKPVDGRCDLFSLGCVLYRLVTGKPPFRGNDTISTLMSVATDVPAEPRFVYADISQPVSDFVMQLLAKNPDDRPQNAQEVVDTVLALEKRTVKASKGARGASTAITARGANKGAVREPGREAGRGTGRGEKSKTVRAQGTSTAWKKYGLLMGAGLGGLAAVVAAVLFFSGAFAVNDPAVRPPEPIVKAPDGKVGEVNRKSAEWVIRHGGNVSIRLTPGGAISAPISDIVELPKKDFYVQAVELLPRSIGDDGLAHLAGLTELESLGVAGNTIRGPGLLALRESTKLKELDLTESSLTDGGMEHVAAFRELTTLHLGSTSISNLGIDHLRGLTQLKELSLSETSISEGAFPVLEQMKQLATLALFHSTISDAAIAKLRAALPGCLVVTETSVAERVFELNGMIETGEILDIDQRTNLFLIREPSKLPPRPFHITHVGLIPPPLPPGVGAVGPPMRSLSEADCKMIAAIPNLRILDLISVRLPPTGLAPFKKLSGLYMLVMPQAQLPPGSIQTIAHLRSLRGIVLDNMPLTDDELLVLKGLKNLNMIAVAGTSITDDGLANFKDLPNLKALMAGRTQVTDRSMPAIAKMSRLQTLNLDCPAITDDGVAHLAKSTQLRTLGLGRTAITSKGLSHLKGLTELTSLTLDGTAIDDEGLEAIRGMKKLYLLNLMNTRIGDAGLAHLEDTPAITNLTLTGTKVTDAGMKHLLKLPKVYSIYLIKTDISDEGLAELQNIKTLTFLNVLNTKVTPAGMEQFRQALPKCTLVPLPTKK